MTRYRQVAFVHPVLIGTWTQDMFDSEVDAVRIYREGDTLVLQFAGGYELQVPWNAVRCAVVAPPQPAPDLRPCCPDTPAPPRRRGPPRG